MLYIAHCTWNTLKYRRVNLSRFALNSVGLSCYNLRTTHRGAPNRSELPPKRGDTPDRYGFRLLCNPIAGYSRRMCVWGLPKYDRQPLTGSDGVLLF